MYKDMAAILNEAETENFKLDKFKITQGDFRAAIAAIPEGEYVRLLDKRFIVPEVIMSNTPMEKRTNSKFVKAAHGDVLIAGLGIGMIPLAIQDKPEVTSITIVEKEPEIIKLIKSQINFNSKVTIIEEDIYTFRPDCKYNCIYFDIWPHISEDVYKDMLFLKDGFRRYLKPNEEDADKFIGCWAEMEARFGRPLL